MGPGGFVLCFALFILFAYLEFFLTFFDMYGQCVCSQSLKVMASASGGADAWLNLLPILSHRSVSLFVCGLKA